jgi:hypothetical protein
VFVTVGTPVRYLGGNRLLVPLDDREIELAVGNLTLYRQRLARDVARFLSGDRELPRSAEYRWSWYIYPLWLAPAGLPFLAGSLDETGGRVFLWCLLAAFLVFLAYVLIQREKWAKGLRLSVAAVGSAAAYAAVVWASQSGSSLHISPASWHYLTTGEYRIRLPGQHVVQTRLRDGQRVLIYLVDLKQQQSAFTFGIVDLPASPRNPTEQQLKALFEDGVLALHNAMPGVTRHSDQRLSALKNGECPGREYVFHVSNRTLKGTIVVRMYFHQGRLYTLVAAGKNVQPLSPEVRMFFDSFYVH